MSRIVVTTWGSLGDLHPYLAIALGLHARGHEVIVATNPCYEKKIECLGLGFRPVRPDNDWLLDAEKVRRFSHPRFGLLRVGRELLMATLRESYEDTLAASENADLLVAMLGTYATRLVAEKRGIPWVSAMHIPLGFFSAHDPPILEASPFLSRKLRFLGPVFWGPLLGLGKRASRMIARPWYRLRAEIGLPPATEGNPLVDGHSSLLVLALFSRLLADKQPDWPPQTIVTGLPVYDRDDGCGLSASLERFLDEGPPPIVFTLGSIVSMNAGAFYEHSAASASMVGRRAVLVCGEGNRERLPSLTAEMIAVEYAPFSQLFPRAAAIVHHGGVGTTGIAMRSGRPMLVVPFAWDQPDNADRVSRMGIARTIPKRRYTPKRAAAALRRLLDDPTYSQRASQVAEQMQEEQGVSTACDALERLLRQHTREE
jgi:rhamnosyltransferase subunit B